jgi:PDZ domain-containing protein
MKLNRRLAALVPVAALMAALWSVSLPYFAEGPGPARDVEPLIRVTGHDQFPSRGHFILTSVGFTPVNAFQAIGAWLDPVRNVVSEDVLIPPGESSQEANRRSVSQMDQSKIDAAVVVLSRLAGYPKSHAQGLLVESVGEGCPADGKLFPGDLLVTANGKPVSDSDQLGRIIRSTPGATPVRFQVKVSGRTFPVSTTPRRCQGSGRRLVGITTVPNFPFPITISSGDIGGPSAGLMWALGLFDLLTPGDLTGGRTIAGTGQIEPDGTIVPIGGVQLKIAAAKAAGATVFLLPRGNLADAREVAGNLPLVPVSRFQDALAYLQRGGSSSGSGESGNR